MVDLDHDLPTFARSHDSIEGRPRVLQREHRVDGRADGPVVGEPCELDQLLSVRFDHEIGRVNALGDLRRRFFGDRNQPAAFTERRPADRASASPPTVSNTRSTGSMLPTKGAVGSSTCSAPKPAHELGGAGRRGADHVRPAPFRELRRQVAHAAGRAEDEDALIRLQLAVHEEALPRRQPGREGARRSRRGSSRRASVRGTRPARPRTRRRRRRDRRASARRRRRRQRGHRCRRRGSPRPRKARTTRSPAGGRSASRARRA